ncbi:MAG: Gp49 family protein [Hyphomicrobium sp.]|uniref:Gp49 family protein n=1 Tax=Hyphomicrobium sp. TaxID=82 RepID=UPI00356AFDEE
MSLHAVLEDWRSLSLNPRAAVPRKPVEEEKQMVGQVTEGSIEQEIQNKGLTAPRLTPADIDASIVGENYHVFPGTTLTICMLTLRNGYHVTGEAAAASPENFDAAIGKKIARDNARNKIWALEGYLLRSKLAA